MKQLKRYMITGFIFVSILGTLSHFFYNWFGENPLVGLFSPANESTWEHMKLLFFPAVLYMLLTHQRLNAVYPGIVSAMSSGIIAGTLSIPLIFYTYTGVLGYNLLVLDIAAFYLSTSITFLIAYKFTDSKKLTRFKTPAVTVLLILTVCFWIFTFYAPGIGLFAVPV